MGRNGAIRTSVLMMQERLERMATEARENMETARTRQKTWYDKGAHKRSFQPGDQVLVPLPTSSSKLTAQWQGLYSTVKQMGKVNYLLMMYNRRKETAVFHVNMLQKWHTPTSTNSTPWRHLMSRKIFPFGMMAKAGQHKWAVN